MRRATLAGSFFVIAVVILASVTVASASDPELFVCEKYGEGSYTESKCSSGTSGEYERAGLEAGPNVGFTISGGTATFKTSKQALECKSVEGVGGESNGPTELAKVQIKMTGCTESGKTCTSKGAVAGEVKTNSLKAKLVFLKKSASAPAGLLLEPESGSEFSPEIECNCPNMNFKLTGSVIGEVTPTNEAVEVGEAIYGENSEKTGQKWVKVEEEGTSHELTLASEKAALTATFKLTWEIPVGVALKQLGAPKRFRSTSGKYPLVLSAALVAGTEQTFTLGAPAEDVVCEKVSFKAPKMARPLLGIVFTPTDEKCTYTVGGIADPNVVARCNAFETFSGGLTRVPACEFEVTDKKEAGKNCIVVVNEAKVSGHYKAVGKELEVAPSSKSVAPQYEYTANIAACGLANAKGEGENHIKFLISATRGGVAEGIEVK